MTTLADLRKDYSRASLDEASAPAEPLQLFERWFEEALRASVLEPNAMTLATVSAQGRPSTRIVLIKGCDERGFTWYTNYDSRKGREIAENPYGALQFHWVELERQVRIEGRIERVTDQESDAYYRSRPLESRLGAWASPQSAVIASREVLERELERRRTEFGAEPPRPSHWGGYRLVPHAVEFWQGRPSRLHDRLRYSLDGDRWLRERLAP